MDIVDVKKDKRRSRGPHRLKRISERRHTTEVHFDQLPSHTVSELERDSLTSLSTEDLTPRGEQYHHPVADYQNHHMGGPPDSSHSSHMVNGHQPTFKHSSWGDLNPPPSLPPSNNSIGSSFKGSQGDVYQELTEHAQYSGGDGDVGGVAGHQYQLSYDLAMDNVLTPFAPTEPSSSSSSANNRSHSLQKSHVSHVLEEMVTTEMTYVRDLSEVIEGYLMPLQMRTSILPFQLDSLFGNITEVRDFHSSFLKQLIESSTSISRLGECFLNRADGFKNIYTQYCNNYPNSIRVFADLSKKSEISRFFKTCQQRLNHLLPLGAYLLKPVQRVLKYSLLLSGLVKNTRVSAVGFSLIKSAMVKMTEVAEHINAMKRKYDTAVHVQELQSLVRGNENLDLTKFGDLVLEDHFRFSAAKGSSSTFRGRQERYVFLFQRLFLVTKKEEVGYQYKMHVEMKDLQLTERVDKEPTCLQIRQVSSGRASTFQARTSQQKEEWVLKIKLLLVDSIPHLPDRTREMIMRGFEVPRDPSPSREHQRHVTVTVSDEPKPVAEGVAKGSSFSSPLSNKRSHSLGRNVSPQNTSPPKPLGLRGRYVSSPTGKPLSSLTGFLISSIHSPLIDPPLDHTLDHTHDFAHSHNFLGSPDQRDSGYSDTVPTDQQKLRPEGEGPRSEGEERPLTPDKNRTRKLFSHEQMLSTPESDHKPSVSYTHQFNSPAATPPFSGSPVPDIDHMTEGIQEPADDSNHVTEEPENGTGHVISHMTNIVQEDNGMRNEIATENHHDITEHAQYNHAEFVPQDAQNHSEQIVSEQAQHKVSEHAQYDMHLVTEHAQFDKHMVTEEDETLFDDLMQSFTKKLNKKTSSTDLDWGDSAIRSSLTPGCLQMLSEAGDPPDSTAELSSSDVGYPPTRERSMDEESTTPRASPYTSPSTIRRWSIQKRRSYDHNDPDDSTPKASPYIRRHQSANAQIIPRDGELGGGGGCATTVFSHPILDPPTPFRTPFPTTIAEPLLLPFPDELGQEPYSSDQDTLPSSDTEALPSREPTPDSDKARKHSSSRAKTLPPNMSFEDMKAVGKTKTGRSVRRSRSFGNRSKILHPQEGSLSTDNSPLPSPIFSSKKNRFKDVRYPSPISRNASSNPRGSPAPSVAVLGLISTTRTTPELQDIPLIQVDPKRPETQQQQQQQQQQLENRESLILLPPMGFEGSPERSDSRGSSVSREGGSERESAEREDKSLLSFLRLKPKRSSRSNTPSDLALDERRYEPSEEVPPDSPAPYPMATPTNALPSMSMVASRPNDIISFEDALETCAQYATETGKTARTARREAESAASPGQTKKKDKKKKKKQRHGHTVANIDADTIRQVKEKMADNGSGKQRKSSDSKVHQLAREYSQKIKDRSKIITRHSTVLEELDYTPVEDVRHPVKPVWLADLRDRRQCIGGGGSLEDILDRAANEDDTSSVGSSGASNGEDGTENGNGTRRRGVTKSRTMDGRALFRGAEFRAEAGEEEVQKKRRFKGWVKSLAARFGKKEGTTL